MYDCLKAQIRKEFDEEAKQQREIPEKVGVLRERFVEQFQQLSDEQKELVKEKLRERLAESAKGQLQDRFVENFQQVIITHSHTHTHTHTHVCIHTASRCAKRAGEKKVK